MLSERELHSRYEVAVEQYITTINIEAETAASIARTMLLPAAIRWLGTLKEVGITALVEESAALVDQFVERIFALEAANRDHPEDVDILDEAKYVQTTVFDGDGRRPRGRRQARAHRARRPVAAPEVLGDALRQVASAATSRRSSTAPRFAGPSSF